MAGDFEIALKDIIFKDGGVDPEILFKQLKAENRYQRDVY
jgi:sulfite reductase alpha subunit-like flavoprotein